MNSVGKPFPVGTQEPEDTSYISEHANVHASATIVLLFSLVIPKAFYPLVLTVSRKLGISFGLFYTLGASWARYFSAYALRLDCFRFPSPLITVRFRV
jgi:hypothetical protein